MVQMSNQHTFIEKSSLPIYDDVLLSLNCCLTTIPDFNHTCKPIDELIIHNDKTVTYYKINLVSNKKCRNESCTVTHRLTSGLSSCLI